MILIFTYIIGICHLIGANLKDGHKPDRSGKTVLLMPSVVFLLTYTHINSKTYSVILVFLF